MNCLIVCFDAYLIISVQLSDLFQVMINKIGTYKPKCREILWCGHNLMLEVSMYPKMLIEFRYHRIN